MKAVNTFFLYFFLCAGSFFLQAQSTWSITMVDTATKQVAVGTVTCLANNDLLLLLPVVVVGKGVGASQSAVDSDGRRRQAMYNGLMSGRSPDQIFTDLSPLPSHQQRQYGIVDTTGRALTFTGTQCGAWAGGVRGSQGNLVFSIQGNVLAGSCVVSAIQTAILDSSLPDLPARLMAGMLAARSSGGDGRCSCGSSPAACGCPPSGNRKSGHIGCMIVARPGDTDTPTCNSNGCANGRYWLKLNVARQSTASADPVTQLQALYDLWRKNQTDLVPHTFSIPYL